MDAHERGDVTEATVLAELKQRGIGVSIPFGDNERYDIVATAPDERMLRIQIKTGRKHDGYIEFHGKSQHTNSGGNTYSTYEGDVDYFVVYVPDTDSLYLIGEWEFATSMRLRVSEPDQDHETIHWAEDFEFDDRWPPRPDPKPSERGHPALEKSLSLLREHDLTVARVLTGDEYDLLVDLGAETSRMAVEAGWKRGGRIRFHPDDTVDRDAIDWFLVYCHEINKGYLVSPDEFDKSISLRVSQPEVEMPSVNWAADYAFEKRWPH